VRGGDWWGGVRSGAGTGEHVLVLDSEFLHALDARPQVLDVVIALHAQLRKGVRTRERAGAGQQADSSTSPRVHAVAARIAPTCGRWLHLSLSKRLPLIKLSSKVPRYCPTLVCVAMNLPTSCHSQRAHPSARIPRPRATKAARARPRTRPGGPTAVFRATCGHPGHPGPGTRPPSPPSSPGTGGRTAPLRVHARARAAAPTCTSHCFASAPYGGMPVGPAS